MGKLESFIHTVPHMSWVQGAANVAFLRARFKALSQIPLFQGMEYSEDPVVLNRWMPLVMKERKPGPDGLLEPMAATRTTMGTDVDYGRLTQLMINQLTESGAMKAFSGHDV